MCVCVCVREREREEVRTVIHFELNGILREFFHFHIKLCCCLFSFSYNSVNILICYCAILGTEYHFGTISHHLQQIILIDSCIENNKVRLFHILLQQKIIQNISITSSTKPTFLL